MAFHPLLGPFLTLEPFVSARGTRDLNHRARQLDVPRTRVCDGALLLLGSTLPLPEFRSGTHDTGLPRSRLRLLRGIAPRGYGSRMGLSVAVRAQPAAILRAGGDRPNRNSSRAPALRPLPPRGGAPGSIATVLRFWIRGPRRASRASTVAFAPDFLTMRRHEDDPANIIAAPGDRRAPSPAPEPPSGGLRQGGSPPARNRLLRGCPAR